MNYLSLPITLMVKKTLEEVLEYALSHERPAAATEAARLLGQSALDYARTHHQATRMVAAKVALDHRLADGHAVIDETQAAVSGAWIIGTRAKVVVGQFDQ